MWIVGPHLSAWSAQCSAWSAQRGLVEPHTAGRVRLQDASMDVVYGFRR
ncbi:hypothetical protein [Streptosporangium roseum]